MPEVLNPPAAAPAAPAPTTPPATPPASSAPAAPAGAQPPAAPDAPPAAKSPATPAPAPPVVEPKLGNDGKPAGDTTTKPPKAAPVEFKFVPPEGFTIDADVSKRLSESANKHGLTQDAMQGVLNDMLPFLEGRTLQTITATHEATKAQWAEDLKNDREIGGEKLAENIAVANKALALAPPELLPWLHQIGADGYPPLVKWMHSVAKRFMAEDTVLPSSPTGNPAADAVTFEGAAAKLYGPKKA